jgi:hypothetical protein
MSAEVRRVVILGVLACLLGGYTYITTPEKKTLGAGTGRKTDKTVLEFTPERVTHIALLFESQRVECQRTTDGWKQTATGARIPPDAIEDFLTNLKKLINLGAVEGAGTQLSEYGLQPPTAQITLQVEGEGMRTLTLGKHNPVQTSLYAQINESSEVVLVGAVVLWDMRKLVTAANNAAG